MHSSSASSATSCTQAICETPQEQGARDEGRGNSKSDLPALHSSLAPRPSSLERNAAGQHLPVHDPVAGETVERMRECCRVIVLEKKVANPGEAVTEQR